MNFKNILSLSLLLSILQMFAKFASSDEAAGEKKEDPLKFAKDTG